jgi:hypothetical protein
VYKLLNDSELKKLGLNNSKKYPYLYISEDGLKCYDTRKNKFLDINIKQNKYPQCAGIFVHRIVAETYCYKADESFEVNHIDGNIINNHYKNLEWVSHSDNIKHSYHVLGRKSNFCRKLTDEDKKRISVMNTGKNNPAAKTRKIIFSDDTEIFIYTRKELIDFLEKRFHHRYCISTIKNILNNPNYALRSFGIKKIITYANDEPLTDDADGNDRA